MYFAQRTALGPLLGLAAAWAGCSATQPPAVQSPAAEQAPQASATPPEAGPSSAPTPATEPTAQANADDARTECTVRVADEEIVISMPRSEGTLTTRGVHCERHGAQHAGELELQVELAAAESADAFAERVLGGHVNHLDGPRPQLQLLRLAPEGTHEGYLEAAVWDIKIGELELRVGAFYDEAWSESPQDVQALLRQIEIRRRKR